MQSLQPQKSKDKENQVSELESPGTSQKNRNSRPKHINYFINIKRQNRKKAILENRRKTPENARITHKKLQRSIQIKKVTAREDSSLEREFAYINSSESYDPDTVFKQFPVITSSFLIYND